MLALVRAPSPAFAHALSTHPDRLRIDSRRATSQHAAFVTALRDAAVTVVELAPEPDLPDATFVSDIVLALPDAAEPDGRTALVVVARPGARSRRPEVTSVAERVQELVPEHTRRIRIEEPGTLDCGDVIVLGERIAIGLSGRTNEHGAHQLARAAASVGYRAFLCPVTDRLHLASAVTPLGPRRLVGTAAGFASLDAGGAGLAPAGEVDRILVPDEETAGANVLAVGGTCLMAAGHPVTAAALRVAGEQVVELELDEFIRADGGPTCLVVLVP